MATPPRISSLTTINGDCAPWLVGAQYKLPCGKLVDYSTPMDDSFIESAKESKVVLADGTVMTHIKRVWPKKEHTSSNGILESYGVDGKQLVCVKYCLYKPHNFDHVLETLSDKPTGSESYDFYNINLACIPAETLCNGSIFIMPFAVGTVADEILATSLYKRGLKLFISEIAATCASMIRRKLVFSDMKADNIILFNTFSPTFSDRPNNYSAYLCDLETFHTLESDDLMCCTYPVQQSFCRTTADLVLLNMVYSFLVLILSIWSISHEFKLPFQSLSHGELSRWSDNYSFNSPKHKYWTLVDLYGDSRPDEIRQLEIDTKSTLIDMVRLSPARRIDRAIQHFEHISGNESFE